VIEKMQYTAYGAAVTHLYQGSVRGDFDSNGGVDGNDLDAFELAWENGESSTDVNFDGGIDSADLYAFVVIWATGELSTDIYESHAGACQTTAVRFGYAGYVRDGSANGDRVYTDAAAGLYHVRHRVYDPELGRWTRRDPLGYVDGGSLYDYVGDNPVVGRDPTGLVAACGGCDTTIAACTNFHKQTKDAIAQLKENKCDYTIKCSDQGECAAGTGRYGYTDKNAIYICCPLAPSGKVLCETLAHELTHVLQNCTVGVPEPGRQSGSDVLDRICREKEAIYYSGSCCKNGFFRKNGLPPNTTGYATFEACLNGMTKTAACSPSQPCRDFQADYNSCPSPRVSKSDVCGSGNV
jgi:RHS repeat-associated protein